MIDRSFDRSIRARRVRISGNTNDLDHNIASAELRIERVSDKISKGCGALRTAALFASVALIASAAPALANGFGESRPWQFETTTDMVNRGYIADLIERKKGGYYDSFGNTFNTTNNNTTNIDKQINCSVTAQSVGNTGNNAMEAAASSPGITNTGTTSASTVGNTATNGIGSTGPGGVIQAVGNTVTPPGSEIYNDQTNDGSTLNSDINDSATNVSSGPVTVGDGETSQVLNSAQDNLGDQTATITDSSACTLTSGPIN